MRSKALMLCYVFIIVFMNVKKQSLNHMTRLFDHYGDKYDLKPQLLSHNFLMTFMLASVVTLTGVAVGVFWRRNFEKSWRVLRQI